MNTTTSNRNTDNQVDLGNYPMTKFVNLRARQLNNLFRRTSHLAIVDKGDESYLWTGGRIGANIPKDSNRLARLVKSKNAIFAHFTRPVSEKVMVDFFTKIDDVDLAPSPVTGHTTFEFSGADKKGAYYLYIRESGQVVDLNADSPDVQWMEFVQALDEIKLVSLTNKGDIRVAKISNSPTTYRSPIVWEPMRDIETFIGRTGKIEGIRLFVDSDGREALVMTTTQGVYVRNNREVYFVDAIGRVDCSSDITINTSYNDTMIVADKTGRCWELSKIFDGKPVVLPLGRLEMTISGRKLWGPETNGLFVETKNGIEHVLPGLQPTPHARA